ncbi:MAG: thioredoxin [Bacteroidetes bacterium]|nr:thioredoxin [Bacteroidota bacterium]
MLRLLFSFAFSVILMIGANAQVLQQVNANKFQELTKTGEGIILDVRTSQEYSRGHIEGSTLISVSDREFVNKVNLLQKDKPVYLYCLTGSRSSAAANYMAKIGFNKLYNLQQGIMDWNRRGFPTVQSEVTVASENVEYSEESFQKLISSEKVVLIDFHAPWCAPCKKMSPVIEKLAKDYKGKAKIEKVDVEANKAITKTYQVQTIPGFVLFKDGQKVWSHKGIITYNELSKTIQQYL